MTEDEVVSATEIAFNKLLVCQNLACRNKATYFIYGYFGYEIWLCDEHILHFNAEGLNKSYRPEGFKRYN